LPTLPDKTALKLRYFAISAARAKRSDRPLLASSGEKSKFAFQGMTVASNSITKAQQTGFISRKSVAAETPSSQCCGGRKGKTRRPDTNNVRAYFVKSSPTRRTNPVLLMPRTRVLWSWLLAARNDHYQGNPQERLATSLAVLAQGIAEHRLIDESEVVVLPTGIARCHSIVPTAVRPSARSYAVHSLRADCPFGSSSYHLRWRWSAVRKPYARYMHST
jgi:hypothetical protein